MSSSGWVVASPTGDGRWRRAVLLLLAVTVAVGVAAGAAPMRLAGAQDQIEPPDDVDDTLPDDDDDDDGGGDDDTCGEDLHYGHTTSIPGSDGSSLDHLMVADFNGDDHPDVAAAEREGGGVRVWLNDGPDDDYAPSFTEAPHSPYPIGDEQHAGHTAGLVATDLDGDGNPDLAATSSGGGAHGQGSVEVLLHSGDPAAPFAGAPTSYEVRPGNDEDDARPRDLVAVEATDDGVVDLAVLNKWDDDPNRGAVVVLEGHGDGTFTEPDWNGDASATVARDDQVNLVAGDFDGDGDDDLASSANKLNNDNGSISVVENTADGLKSLGYHGLKGPDPNGLVAADVTGNGRADVAVGTNGYRPPPGVSRDEQDQLSVLLADGDGGLAAPQSYYHRDEEKQVSSPGVDAVMPADMNADGPLDLVTVASGQGHHANYLTSWVWLWTGDGNGGFTWSAGCEIGDGSTSNDAVIADFVGNEAATDVMAARRDGLVVLHPPPGALRGRVIEEAGVEGEAKGLEGAEAVDEEMTEPIEGVTVIAERVGGDFAWGPPVVKHADTDTEGFYPDEVPEDSPFGDEWEPRRVVPLVPGLYDVTVEAEGYRPETEEAVEVVSWDPGEDPTVVDFVLAPVGEIDGTVEDADSGDPLDGVAVTVTSLDDELSGGEPEVVGEATSAAGEFVVDKVDPGQYRVTGELEGYESDSAEAVVRDETDYEATVGLELEPKPGVITGQVTDAGDGDPIAGADVAITANEGGSGPIDGLTGDDGHETETGADGRYEVAGLEPGEYQVAADADGYESARVGPVEVDPGALTEVNLALAPPGDDDPPDDDDPDDEGGGDGGGDPGGETGGDPGGETGGESGGESAGESGGEAGGESAGETGLEPSGDSAGESAGESGGEAGGESAGETGLEPSGDSAGESAGETGGETGGQAGGESAGEPGGETGGEPAGDSATEGGGETGGGQAGDSAGESAGETGGESAGEVAAEPAVDAAGEPAIAQTPPSEPAPAAAEASAEPAAAEPAGDPAMAPGESGVPGEAAAADQPQASGAGERVRQVAPPVETEGVPAAEETGWLATAATASGQLPASAVGVWVAGVALAAVAGWAGRRRRAQPATPTWALARVPADPPAGPHGDDLAGHTDSELAWMVRGLR